MDEIISQLQVKTNKIIEALKTDLSGIRTGRANPGLIENVKVQVYGQMLILKEVGMIAAPDPKMLTVQPWDANNVQPIINSIRDSGLGLNPAADSGIIRIPLPQITQERRQEFIKLVGSKAEEKKIQIRNVRREVMEGIDKEKKVGSIGEDEYHRASEQIQKAIDAAMDQLEAVAKTKEAELQEI